MKQFVTTLLFYFSISSLTIGQTFQDVPNIPFPPVIVGTIDLADFDGDNDLDVFLTGFDSIATLHANLYMNDGAGNFTEVVGNPFTPTLWSSTDIGDFDGDGDMDILSAGLPASPYDPGFLNLYINDGTGSFTEMAGAPFAILEFALSRFFDFDGDGDLDIFHYGYFPNSSPGTIVYVNDGQGNYSISSHPFPVFNELSSVSYADIDGDSDLDIFFVGSLPGSNYGDPYQNFFINEGQGNYTENVNITFPQLYLGGNASFADIDGDNDLDMIFAGSAFPDMTGYTGIFTNDGAGNFSEMPGVIIDSGLVGELSVNDFDNDNDPDILISGDLEGSLTDSFFKLYENDGTGTFTESPTAMFEPFVAGDLAVGDVDNNGYLDIAAVGNSVRAISEGTPISKLYLNGLTSSLFDIEKPSFEVQLYPNPASMGEITLQYESDLAGSLAIQIYDINGRKIIEKNETVLLGRQNISVDISLLKPGHYFLKLDTGKALAAKLFTVK